MASDERGPQRQAEVAHELTHVLQHRLPRRADGSGAEAKPEEAGGEALAQQLG